MAKSTTHANAVLAAIGQGTGVAAQTWISLHSGDPGTTGANEIAGGAYARVRVNQDGTTSPFWGTPASAAMVNSGAITFPEGGDGDTVTHFGSWTASSGGNFIRGGALDSSFDYDAAVTPEFASGALELTEA